MANVLLLGSTCRERLTLDPHPLWLDILEEQNPDETRLEPRFSWVSRGPGRWCVFREPFPTMGRHHKSGDGKIDYDPEDLAQVCHIPPARSFPTMHPHAALSQVLARTPSPPVR